MNKKFSIKDIIRILLILSASYIILQCLIFYFNDKNLSQKFWIENKNNKELIEAGLPEKSGLTPAVNFISDNHFWLLISGSVIVLVFALFYRKKNEKRSMLLFNIFFSVIILLLLTTAITWILKISVGKSRPFTNLDQYKSFSLSMRFQSFPSGHTTETFSFLVPVMYFLRRYYVYIISILYGIAAVITRVILADHYFSDVLFGIYITAFAGCIVCFLIENRQEKALD